MNYINPNLKDLVEKDERKAADWEQYLQTTCLTKKLYLEYINNSQNSTVKN